MTEEIREIEEFPNYYVTSFGRVLAGPNRSHRACIEMSLFVDKDGYSRVSLRRLYKRYVHILVAKAFIPNPNNLPTVNHKNGKEKWNNRVDNLEWATYHDQNQHALETGLFNLGADYGISLLHGTRKKPWQVRFYNGVGKDKTWGYFETKEEAQIARDRICDEQGLIRPLRRAA